MVSLIIGAADSGKSEYAEKLLLSEAGHGRKIYMATMKPGEKASDRIARHVKRRDGMGFETVECGEGLLIPSQYHEAFLLFEDVPNYVANVMFLSDGSVRPFEECEALMQDELSLLMDRYSHIYFVTGDLSSGGAAYGDLTLDYLRLLGHIQQFIAARAHRLIEVVAGCPTTLNRDAASGLFFLYKSR